MSRLKTAQKRHNSGPEIRMERRKRPETQKLGRILSHILSENILIKRIRYHSLVAAADTDCFEAAHLAKN